MRHNRLAIAITTAAAITMSAEGLRQYVYMDPGGIPTTCFGTTGKDVVIGKKYSLSECKAFLTRDLLKAVDTVERCHPGLPDDIVIAFADAVYNVGPVIACNSTASKYLAAGDYKAACNQLPRWNKANIAGVYVELPGLTKRRELELQFCLRGLT